MRVRKGESMNRIKSLLDFIDKLALSPSEIDYVIERYEYFKAELFKQAKFNVGDYVALVETPEITDKVAWGWTAYKDILVKGRTGEVKEVDHYKGRFRYGIEFVFGKGTFTFYEDKLVKGSAIKKICETCGNEVSK